MGQGGCWSLCSGVNSCTPLQGLIKQVSLEIPATETPGGRGSGKRTECNVRRVSAALLRKSSSSRTFLLERIYFASLSKMSPSIFSSAGWLLAFNQSGSPLHEERLCYRHAAVFKDTKVTAFMNFHSGAYCFHQLLYLMCTCLHRFLRDLHSICFFSPSRLDENVFV